MPSTNVDLNLLRALTALVETRSVTRAARRLGITQPAMSHTLARLRVTLGDALLVKIGANWTLTERAEALGESAREALGRVEQLLRPNEPSEPGELVRSFRVSLADYVELVLLPSLCGRLSAQAPGVSVVCRPPVYDPMKALHGGAELWLGVNAPTRSGLFVQTLFTDSYACAMSTSNPLARKKIGLREFAAMRHVQIAPAGTRGGPLDDALAERGLERVVAVRVPYFLSAPRLASHSDLVVTAPRRVLAAMASGLHCFESPIALPTFTVQQAWLAKHHADAGHQWFRAQVKAATQPGQAGR